jgi:hypothetical protein
VSNTQATTPGDEPTAGDPEASGSILKKLTVFSNAAYDAPECARGDHCSGRQPGREP